MRALPGDRLFVEYGAPCWPNGADLAPDGHLRTRIEEQAGLSG